MKKFMSKLCVLLTALFLSFSFAGCFDFGDSGNKMCVSNENIKYEYTELLGWQVKITGTIENTTGKDLSYISVEYKIYDSDNAVIGTAIDNANSIGKGEKWKFEAMSFSFFDKKPEKVSFSKIESIRDF